MLGGRGERTSSGIHRAAGDEAALNELVRVTTKDLAVLAAFAEQYKVSCCILAC